ncbi:LysR family transcriptional regulator [Duganella sp. CY15W]|uniref:LysR family transcriptional regulator n=1 Tax=Duganella sp. CY15W TaxID=2692172 RepID=UPI00136FEDF0|nr:LysR family transcriptional regulator [Duganella sp. CY15W]MYM31770.1 LysR family transcriptional regulator [Duganella sp. CY15W]
MKRNLDLGLLRTLICISETGSMSGAAQRLYVTQGAVSHQVKRLEQLLDQRLLERGNDGVRLSDAGLRLVSEGRELLRMHDELLASFTVASVTGRVRLGVPYDLLARQLPPMLQAFIARYPQVEVVVTAGTSPGLRRQYEAGELDLVILEEMHGSSSGRVLRLDNPVWVGKIEGAAWTRQPLPVSLAAPDCVFRPLIQSVLGAAGRDWYTVVDYPSIEATIFTVLSDDAVSVLLASTVPSALQVLDDSSGLPRLPQFAITLQGFDAGDSPAAAALADAIVEGYVQLNAAMS